MAAVIRFYDFVKEFGASEAAAREAVGRVVFSGRFVLGPELEAFEQEFARYLGVAYAIGTNSGTDALVLTLDALGIGPGDEVITTPFSFFASAEAILRVGATPVFADVEPDTLCVSAEAVAQAAGARARAVVLVHIFGHCTDLDSLQAVCSDKGLLLIEDACQAVGASWRGRRLGTFGVAGCFSFYPTKNLACLGDGGAIVTNDSRLAGRVRQLRVHGRDAGRFVQAGYNSRLDELQAALLRRHLPGLDEANSRRRALAASYDEGFQRCLRTVKGRPGCIPNCHQYAVLTPERDRLQAFLAERGVETAVYYGTPLHREPALAGFSRQELPEVERACREVLCLPVRPSLTDAEQVHIINSVREFFGNG